MTQKTKARLFYILTLGIGYLWAKKKAKEIAETKNEVIIASTKIPFQISELITALGGSDNILEVTATISNLKVKLENDNLIQPEELKKLGAKGSFKSANSLTILFGDNSQAIAEELKSHLN